MKINRVVLALFALLAIVATAGTAVALSGEESTPATPTTASFPTPAPRFSSAAADALAAARGEEVALGSDAVDVGARSRGANPDAGRFARRSLDGADIYLLPAEDGLCITSTNGLEVGCSSGTEVSASSVLCAPSLPRDTVEVFGIAPDGIASVNVNLDDGTTRDVKVVGNVYIYQAPVSDARPLTISWSNGKESGELSAAVPADFRSGNCAKPSDRRYMRRADPSEPPRIVTAPTAK